MSKKDPRVWEDHLTVGMLLDFIEKYNIPRDAAVFYQRIEDVYFEKNGWTTVDKEGYWCSRLRELNNKIDSGEFYDKEKYPDMDDPEKYRTAEEDIDKAKEKYIRAFSPVFYKDEKHLFIDAHY